MDKSAKDHKHDHENMTQCSQLLVDVALCCPYDNSGYHYFMHDLTFSLKLNICTLCCLC